MKRTLILTFKLPSDRTPRRRTYQMGVETYRAQGQRAEGLQKSLSEQLRPPVCGLEDQSQVNRTGSLPNL